MKVIRSSEQLMHDLKKIRNSGASIGFVPTMGALHEGHASLVRRSVKENPFTVCSIFINPLQFNDKNDLLKYPRTFIQDKTLLTKNGCDILFNPSNEEMYPEGEDVPFEFNPSPLDEIMEGKYRPGHFTGVAKIVYKLLSIVKPDKAYFGEKDYQQLLIVKKLVIETGLPVKIITGNTIRENDGLAMSSRNTLLNEQQREMASAVPAALMRIKRMARHQPVKEIMNWLKNYLLGYKNIKLEYFEICESETLLPLSEVRKNITARAFIAVKIGNVRLIDNMVV